MNHPLKPLVEKTPEQRDAGERCSVAVGSDSSEEYQETEKELMRSEIGNMIFHGWWVWPAKIPRQPDYEYTEWIDYDMKWKTWSRPMCSFWLRLKWLFRRRSPNRPKSATR